MPANSVVAIIPKDLILTSTDKENWAGEIASKARRAQVFGESAAGIGEWVSTWSGGYTEGLAEGMSKGVREQLPKKLKRRRFRFDESKAKYGLVEGDFSLYNVVWSRACYLGAVWDNEIGVVPFFDMLNHGGRGNENVKLCPVGEVREKPGGEEMVPSNLHPRDMLLIATKVGTSFPHCQLKLLL